MTTSTTKTRKVVSIVIIMAMFLAIFGVMGETNAAYAASKPGKTYVSSVKGYNKGLQVSWKKVKGSKIKYQIQWSGTSIAGKKISGSKKKISGTTYKISNYPGTKYKFRVRAYRGKKYGKWSKWSKTYKVPAVKSSVGSINADYGTTTGSLSTKVNVGSSKIPSNYWKMNVTLSGPIKKSTSVKNGATVKFSGLSNGKYTITTQGVAKIKVNGKSVSVSSGKSSESFTISGLGDGGSKPPKPDEPTQPSDDGKVTYDAANYTNIFNRSGKNIEVRAFYDADYNRNSFDIYIQNGDGNYKIKAIDNTPDKVKRYFDDSTSMPNYGFDIMNKNKGANGGDGYKDTDNFYHVYTKPYTSDIIINVWNSKTGKLIACVKSGWYTDTALNPDNKMFDFATKANNPFYNRYHRIMTDFINESGVRTMLEEGVLDERESAFLDKLNAVCYYNQDDIARHNMANLPGEDCDTWFDGSEREINYTHAYYQVTGIHGGNCNFYAVLEEDIIKNEIGGFTRIQIQGIDEHRYVVAEHNSGARLVLDIGCNYGHDNNYNRLYNDETWRNHVKTYVNHYNDWFNF